MSSQLISNNIKEKDNDITIKIAVAGNVDSGKSTLAGVLLKTGAYGLIRFVLLQHHLQIVHID